MDNQQKWDLRFLEMAKLVASWSKDTSTKVGSVIADGKHRLVSIGYNGFPIGMKDTVERISHRETKYAFTIHAERNALLFANRSLEGCIIYTHPFGPCSVCAGMIIQAGIKRVVFPPMSAEVASRWKDDCQRALDMFKEVGVQADEVDAEKQGWEQLTEFCMKNLGTMYQTCIYCSMQFPTKAYLRKTEVAVVYCDHCGKMQSPNSYKLHPGC